MLKHKKLIALTLLFILSLGALIYQSTQYNEIYAVDPLIVTYNGDEPPDPMFEVFNMLPGDEVIKDFNVKNDSPQNEDIEMFGNPNYILRNFDEILDIEITDLGSSSIIFSGKLEDFFAHTPFGLGNFPSGADKSFRVKIKFPLLSGNEYQGAKVVFDIVWRTTIQSIEVPSECQHLAHIITHKIEGTDGKDHIQGTSASELILSKGGNDKVDGGGGDDCIVGGNGNDKLDGGSGDDVILGGNGNDKLDGQTGRDKLYGEAGNDELFGGTNNDFLDGGPNHDFLKGESGMDTCINGEAVHFSCEL